VTNHRTKNASGRVLVALELIVETFFSHNVNISMKIQIRTFHGVDYIESTHQIIQKLYFIICIHTLTQNAYIFVSPFEMFSIYFRLTFSHSCIRVGWCNRIFYFVLFLQFKFKNFQFVSKVVMRYAL
jgi:hypothetical protein